jgi:hypothetical protein
VWGMKHPFSRDLYEREDESDGTPVVKVTTVDGRVGRYRPDGSRIDGARIDVDPQLCVWIGGPRAAHRLSAAADDGA